MSSTITKKEFELLAKFRASLNDITFSKDENQDLFFLRWIRARDNDSKKAEEMLRKSLHWFEANGIKGILDWTPPESFPWVYPFEITGQDMEGRPVGVLPLGIWDIRTAIESGGRETYIRYVDQILVRLTAGLRYSGKENEPSQFLIVVDMKGLTTRQFTSARTVETVMETFRRFESNFPETLYKALVVNAPGIFHMAFSLVKPLLSARTLQKIQIFNCNEEKWKSVLLQHISNSTLPTKYGGVNHSYDEILSGSLKPHPAQDQEEEVMAIMQEIQIEAKKTRGKGMSSSDNSELIEVTVGAGQKMSLMLNIETTNTILKWEFETVTFDIGFAILNQNGNEVRKWERCDSHSKRQIGSLVCRHVGNYSIVFDNTFSRLRSKTLRYSLIVSPPPEQGSKLIEQE